MSDASGSDTNASDAKAKSAAATVPARSPLFVRINDDMKAAMRAKEADRLLAIRSLLAAIKQKEVDERITVDDAQIVAIVDKLGKQRKDSISQFEAAGRADLVAKETFELNVLAAYLPQQATEAEVLAEIEAAVAAVGASGPQDMGKVMGRLKASLSGRADLTAVSARVKARLVR